MRQGEEKPKFLLIPEHVCVDLTYFFFRFHWNPHQKVVYKNETNHILLMAICDIMGSSQNFCRIEMHAYHHNVRIFLSILHRFIGVLSFCWFNKHQILKKSKSGNRISMKVHFKKNLINNWSFFSKSWHFYSIIIWHYHI